MSTELDLDDIAAGHPLALRELAELRRLSAENEALRKLILEADRLMGHDEAFDEWRERCAARKETP